MTDGSLGEGLARARVPTRVAYIGLILLATLSSSALELDAGRIAERLVRMMRPTVSARDFIDGARNVSLFVGWGLVWMLTSPPGRSKRALRDAALSASALSLSVEVLQLASPTRTASVFDLLTNVGGALAGALAAVWGVHALRFGKAARSFVGLPAALFAACYGLAVLGEAFVPLFRQELGAGASGGPLERLSRSLAAVDWGSWASLPLGDALLFLPAGAFAVAALFEAGFAYRRAAVLATAAAGLLMSLVEVAHGALGIPIQLGAIAVHTGSVATGAAAAAAGLPRLTRLARGADRPRLLLLTYAPVLALWATRPYVPETTISGVVAKLASEWWIPLRSLGARVDMFSVVDVFAPFLLYLPLGALLAVWPLTHRGPLAGFAPAVYFAVATEVAQIFVVERTLDVTDLLIQAAGAAVGYVAIRRAGFGRHGTQLGARDPA